MGLAGETGRKWRKGEKMRAEDLLRIMNTDFYTGVPDSLLSPLCNCLMKKYGEDGEHHVIGANEGNCTAIAAGYHLATGKVPVVYMQNSGEGNMINPAASLLHPQVYGIPVLFVIGWRGEPGTYDEHQHVFQGRVTEKLLRDMEMDVHVIRKDTKEEEVKAAMHRFGHAFAKGQQAAFIVCKGALSYEEKMIYQNSYRMVREDAVGHIAEVAGEDLVVATTGKISRELFEIREGQGAGHSRDFLTVGAMGHSSSIALGIALQKRPAKVWCIDGDGAILMHMGAMAVIGKAAPDNLVHIAVNNEAHETVGGLPTAAGTTDLCLVAKACGYPYVASADTLEGLDEELDKAKKRKGLCFIEVKCAIGSRGDLGRPTTTAHENKRRFMEFLRDGKR